jgi:hypothetical protein
MIADLPPKRVTRRLVFEAPNGNNQATINSVSKILLIKKKIVDHAIITIQRFLSVFLYLFVIKFLVMVSNNDL